MRPAGDRGLQLGRKQLGREMGREMGAQGVGHGEEIGYASMRDGNEAARGDASRSPFAS